MDRDDRCDCRNRCLGPARHIGGRVACCAGVLVIDDFEGYIDEEGNRIYETWIEWRVPLSKLVGVNFSKVREFYLGVDDRANPKPGGSGRIYIDDIRVVRPAPAE